MRHYSTLSMPANPDTPRFDAHGRERPAFVFDYPKQNAELNTLVEAFEQGNFRLVRKRAQSLAETSVDPEVKKAAIDLLGRTEPDPLIRLFLLVALLLFTFLAAWSYV